MANKPPAAHDHRRCIDKALAAAEQICYKNSVKLTPVRKQVFTIILQSHRATGAYTILEALAKALPAGASKPAPPTVYRALAFLQSNRLIHRLASINAYIACCRPARNHESYFLICQHCHNATEIPGENISAAIARQAGMEGFKVRREHVEVLGVCTNCTAKEPG